MSEISTVAIITVQPESADEAEGLLKTLADATHAEDGCLSYSLHKGSEPGVFFTMEKWTDQASLDAHLASPHIAAALDGAGPLLVVPPQIVPGAVIPLDSPKAAF